MTQKFDHDRLKPRDVPSAFETRFSVGSYLAYQGDRFVERFDANSYVMLTMAMDMFELGSTSEALAATLRLARCRWLLISYTSDWLFPSFQSQEIVHTLTEQNQPVSYCNIQSDGGHDSFLLEQELYSYGRLIEAFLANLAAATDVLPSQWPRDAKDPQGSGQHAPTSIFHDLKRIDYNTILELIPPDASVLDLGCGSGGLLERLQQRGHKHLVGVELDQASVIESVSRNVDVIQADLNQGLSSFLDRQFDYVVLSKTLQTVIDVERIVEEMLRVGGRVIVSFPNLGFGPLRSELAHEGRAPRGDATQGFQWYNTPNVRFLTITDFETFCREKQIQIERCVALDTQTGRQVSEDPNLFADMAIVVLSR